MSIAMHTEKLFEVINTLSSAKTKRGRTNQYHDPDRKLHKLNLFPIWLFQLRISKFWSFKLIFDEYWFIYIIIGIDRWRRWYYGHLSNWIYRVLSRVPVPIHVDESKIKYDFTPNLIESSVGFMIVFDQFTMGSVTEGSIWWVFTIAKFIVPTFRNIELDRSTSCNSSITSTIATRVSQW